MRQRYGVNTGFIMALLLGVGVTTLLLPGCSVSVTDEADTQSPTADNTAPPVQSPEAPAAESKAPQSKPDEVASRQEPGEVEVEDASDAPSRQYSDEGVAAFNKGDFETAITHWKKALHLYEEAADIGGEIDTRINLATAYHALGYYKLAIFDNLEKALVLAEKLGDQDRIMSVKSSLGSACIFTREADQAESYLQEALVLAQEGNHPAVGGAILNNLGNFYSARSEYQQALKSYQQAYALAQEVDDALLMAKAKTNATVCASYVDGDKSRSFKSDAMGLIAGLEDSHEKVFMLLALGQAAQRLTAQLEPAQRSKALDEVLGTYYQALQIANRLEDRRGASYALGYLGQVHESHGRLDEALDLTRRAAFGAQETQSPHALYQWQWQIGRLLTAQGHVQEAIVAYRQAVQTLQPIRHDLSIGYGNRNVRSSFRKEIGPLFYDLADALFQGADAADDPEVFQSYLKEARQTIELLKSAELEDYFQDDCVNLLRAKAKGIEELGQTTAVLYAIPLKDRTELLLDLPSGFERVVADVGAQRLIEEVRLFRLMLETRSTHRYIRHSKQLYDWLIRPLAQHLESAGIDTLVFVPDGALGTIPMAALHDGKQFLIAKFAVAVTPGLTLMDPKPIARQEVRLLTTGLSQAVQGFPALEFVNEEVGKLQKLFGGTSLMNQQFRTPAVQKEITENLYSIIHIASHGQFNSDAKKTYLLTYDGKMTLDDLEKLIRPIQFRAQPVELLSLSACQTAVGDDRAALGLAGIAIKAGARSALATLWFVNDQASSDLVTHFYTQIHDDPTISKAKALQRAQLKLLADKRYRHPCYWSPYLIIGNWL